MDREEREDQHEDPVPVDRRAVGLLGLEPLRERRDFGPISEAEVANHRLSRVGRIEDRSHRDAPGRPEDAERAGDRNHPVRRPSAEHREQRRESEVAEGRPGMRGERAAGLSRAERVFRVPDPVEREPAAEEDDQRPGRQVRSIQEQESHEERDQAARPGLALPRLARAPEAVEQLQGGRDEQERAHTRFGSRGRTHGQQREASERRRHGSESPAALRGCGQRAYFPRPWRPVEHHRRRAQGLAAERRVEEEPLAVRDDGMYLLRALPVRMRDGKERLRDAGLEVAPAVRISTAMSFWSGAR